MIFGDRRDFYFMALRGGFARGSLNSSRVILENRFVQRINRGFDLMLDFQKHLNDDQKKKLSKMISDWVAKWD